MDKGTTFCLGCPFFRNGVEFNEILYEIFGTVLLNSDLSEVVIFDIDLYDFSGPPICF